MTEIPTELDRLDPPPRRSRAPARRKGRVEKALDRDLKALPAEYSTGTIAEAARVLAMQLDDIAAAMTPRDVAGHVAGIRMCVVQLREWAPVAEPGDATGEAQTRSEGARALYSVPGVV